MRPRSFVYRTSTNRFTIQFREQCSTILSWLSAVFVIAAGFGTSDGKFNMFQNNLCSLPSLGVGCCCHEQYFDMRYCRAPIRAPGPRGSLHPVPDECKCRPIFAEFVETISRPCPFFRGSEVNQLLLGTTVHGVLKDEGPGIGLQYIK